MNDYGYSLFYCLSLPPQVINSIEPNKTINRITPHSVSVGTVTTSMFSTLSDADAVLPVSPLVEVTASVVLFFTPNAVAVTVTVSVQLLVAMVAPLNETLPEPETAVAVPAHVLVSPLGFATTSPAGRLSMNAMPVSVTLVFGLLIVKVKLVEPFSGILVARTPWPASAARPPGSRPMLFHLPHPGPMSRCPSC